MPEVNLDEFNQLILLQPDCFSLYRMLKKNLSIGLDFSNEFAVFLSNELNEVCGGIPGVEHRIRERDILFNSFINKLLGKIKLGFKL